MENFNTIYIDNYKRIDEEQAGNKIKLTDENFTELKNSAAEVRLEHTRNMIDAEIALQEARVAELQSEIEQATVEEEPAVEPVEEYSEEEEKSVATEEEPVINKFEIEEDVMPFAYQYEKPEEEIAPETIEQIKGLGDAYKGSGITEYSKAMEVKPSAEEEKVITPAEFETVLDKESFSPKASQLKAKVRNEYENLKNKIKATEQELYDLKKEIKSTEDVVSGLKTDMEEPKSMVNNINALKLQFLAESNDEDSKTALQSMGVLYNKNRDIIYSLQEQVNENNSKIQQLKEAEKEKIKESTNLKNEKDEFVQEQYALVKKVNEHDDNLRADDRELSQITGIPDEEVTPVVEESVVEPVTPEENVFTGLRDEEAPKVVANIDSYADVMNESIGLRKVA